MALADVILEDIAAQHFDGVTYPEHTAQVIWTRTIEPSRSEQMKGVAKTGAFLHLLFAAMPR